MKNSSARNYRLLQPDLWLLPLLSAVILGACAYFVHPWGIWFGFVPWWYFCLKSSKTRHLVIGSMIFQFGVSAIGIHWVFFGAQSALRFSTAGSLIAFFVYTFVFHSFIFLTPLLWQILQRRLGLTGAARILSLAFIYHFLEMSWLHLFPWNFGLFWVSSKLPLVEISKWIGFSGLNFLTLLANGLILIAVWPKTPVKFKARALAYCAALFLSSMTLGSYIQSKTKENVETKSVTALAVQGYTSDELKIAVNLSRGVATARGIESIIDSYMELVADALERSSSPVDLIVWPETALPIRLRPLRPLTEETHEVRKLREFLDKANLPLLTGSYLEQQEGWETNAIFHFDKDGNIQSNPYNKTKLMPFGEYVPGAKHFPILNSIFNHTAKITESQQEPFLPKVAEVIWGPLICYEGIFPGIANRRAKSGAQIFLSVSNDSWYGHTSQARQHFYYTAARAIEFGRPMLRVANSGVSGYVSRQGEIFLGPEKQSWVGQFELEYEPHPRHTVYSYWQPYEKASYYSAYMIVILLSVTLKRRRHETIRS